MENKISIIVPIYKVEKYLSKCIESLLVQTFKEIELILVNDGSPDSCGELCDEYAKKDNRIKVIHKKNGGISSARNAGINIATGKYIGFVDGDDYIHPNMYELLYKKAVDSSSDIVLCDYYSIEENELLENLYCNYEIEAQNYTNLEALEELFGEDRIKFVVPWNKLYKRSLFSNLQYEVGRIHEDEFIAHKVLYKSSKVTYLPIKLYYYFQRTNSIMRSRFNIKRLDRVYALKDRVDYFNKINQLNLQHKAEDRYIQSIFSNYKKVKANNIVAFKEIKEIRVDLLMNFKSLLKNPFYNKREKILWILFIINPLLYDFYVKIKERNNKTRKLKNYA
jgi:glycosyltransferase involved in cell wall biosynthesis